MRFAQKLKGQRLRPLILLWLFSASFFLQISSSRTIALAEAAPGIAPPEFFGVVGRDSWYEWNSDPVKFPNRLNMAFLENMARELSQMGARRIRIEFHADSKPGVRGGFIDFAKYDAFINEIAPRYNLKVLGLIAADAIVARSDADQDLFYPRLNQSPDQPDGTNVYIRFFAQRAREIVAHYGDKIEAYEILNEANFWYNTQANPSSIGALMTHIYPQLKAIQPKIKVLLGGILASSPLPMNPAEYLSQIYGSAAVQDFFKNGKHYDGNPFPFDGVGWHPYGATASVSLESLNAALSRMRGWGDQLNKIWVTETGSSGRQGAAGPCGVSQEEQSQAEYLQEFYSRTASTPNDVAAVFWFKYEDFQDNKGYQPWGLVKLESDNQNRYMSEGKVAYYKKAFKTYQALALPSTPAANPTAPGTAPQTINPTNHVFFPETRHNLKGPFLRYWLANGGLALFGLPLTEEFQELNPSDGKIYAVQYFERERFEYHPEASNPLYQVQLGLLGNNLLTLACKSFSRATALPNSPSTVYFSETGHNLTNGFKRYWEQNGGLAIFGFPVSEEISEVNPADGKSYQVQWFERARFEYHPEFAGTKNEILLGLLGSQWLKLKNWLK